MSYDEPATWMPLSADSVGGSTKRRKIARANRLAARNAAPDRVVDEVNKLLVVMAEYSQSILTNLDHISAEPRPTMSAICDHLGVINREAALCRSALRNLQEYARPTARGIPMVFDLRGVLQDALRIALTHVGRVPDTSAVVDLGGEALLVCGHRDRMAQAFLDLCIGALDAIDLGEVSITAGVADRHIEVVFSAKGGGMDESTLARLLDPVFATKALGDGVSLGLCVSRIIIEQHAGHVQVTRIPGKGTAMIVRLPVASE